MKLLAFWNSWRQPTVKPSEKIFYLISLLVFGLTLGLMAFSFVIGDSAAIRWQTASELQPYRSVVDAFDHLGFEFTLDADSYFLIEKFSATDLGLYFSAAYLFFGLVVLGMLALLTVATYLPRIWYAVVASMFMLFLALLQFELLQVFGRADKVFLVGCLLAYLPLSYYFQAFDTNGRVSFVARFSIFALITGVVAYLLFQYGMGIKNTTFFLSTYAYIVPLLLTVVFIVLNSHEIINGILFMLTNSANPASRNTSNHFIVVSAIYLFNLFYAYAFAVGWIDLGIAYVDPFIVYWVSAALGVWGFRKKETLFGFLPFAPYGAIAYTALGIISTAFIAYSFASANDPVREVLEDAILFSHIGVGFVFFMYVLVNFQRLIAQNKAVHKVVYKPGQFEYMWVHLLAGVLASVMLFRSDFFPYRQAFAGFYNYVGDLHRAEGDNFLSEQYYKMAVTYDFQNHRSNYALGSLARMQGDEAMALYYFREATRKKPLPHDYLNMSEILLQNDKTLDAIFILNEGIKLFPKNGEMLNNLGLIYAQKTDILDSAVYYLNESRQVLNTRSTAEANFYAVVAKLNNFSPDSLQALFQPEEAIGTRANELAFYNKQKVKFGQPLNPAYLRDSVLQTVNLCYLYNFALNDVGSGDTAIFVELDRFNKVKANADFSEYLELAKAFKYREVGENTKAFWMLRKLVVLGSEVNPYYNNAFGVWLMEIGQYREAARYFGLAFAQGNAEALLNQAIALSELPSERGEAIAHWQKVLALGKPELVPIAHDLLRILHPDSLSRLDMAKVDDFNKFRLAHYNQPRLTDEQFNTLFNSVADNNLKIMTLVDRMQFYLDLGNVAIAENIRNAMTGVNLEGSTKEVQNALRLVDLQLLHRLKRYDGIANLLKEFTPTRPQKGYQPFYAAVVAEQQGRAKEAERLYQLAIRQLPYREAVPIALAVFYNRQKQAQKGYEVLVDALKPYDDYHQFPPRLLEMYIMQCLEVRLLSFAEDNCARLAEIVSPLEYEKFRLVYEQRKAELAKVTEDWN